MTRTMLRSRSVSALTQCVVLLATFFAGAVLCEAESDIDGQHKFAWHENIGWTNWRDAQDGDAGVAVGPTCLGGFIWAENVGWINTGDGSPTDGVHYANQDDTDFGVNVDVVTGELSGLAWGENIGWVNFAGGALAEPPIPATVDFCTLRLFGFVWGENVGWINLDVATHYVGLELDYTGFPLFMHGPDVAVECPAFDFDQDTDVDLKDFAALQSLIP